MSNFQDPEQYLSEMVHASKLFLKHGCSLESLNLCQLKGKFIISIKINPNLHGQDSTHQNPESNFLRMLTLWQPDQISSICRPVVGLKIFY